MTIDSKKRGGGGSSGGSDTFILGKSKWSFTNTGVRPAPMWMDNGDLGVANINLVEFEFDYAATVRNLRANVFSNGKTGAMDIMVFKNGVVDTLSISVPGSSGDTEYLDSDSFTVVAGDRIAFVCDGNGLGGTTDIRMLQVEINRT